MSTDQTGAWISDGATVLAAVVSLIPGASIATGLVSLAALPGSAIAIRILHAGALDRRRLTLVVVPALLATAAVAPFVFLSANNVFLVLDLVVFPDVNFLIWRNLSALAAIAVLLYGFAFLFGLTGTTSLLGRLRNGIVDDTPDSAIGVVAHDTGDRSVQVHLCHGATRQVQVLRDALLHLFDADPTLTPRDVVVLCHAGIRSWQFASWLDRKSVV